ncbi:MAG: acetyl-CoA acetyltransferase, partial [Candidatus Binatia bacterium]
MAHQPIYILGGTQTDFARNWTKEGKHISAMIREAVTGGLEATGIEPKEVQVGHVGNFAAELYSMQGHLGAFLVDVDPAFSGLPTARHEAACASGSIAILAASAEIEAGRYDLSMVVGVEQMKTVDPKTGGDYLGTAAWYETEAKGIEFPFPKLFGKLGDEYDKRFGLKDEHLARISAVNYSNAKRNPLAQTRNWYMTEDHASATGKFNTVIGGRIKVSDCSQVTDGAVSLFLASEKYAAEYAKRRKLRLDQIPRILGWGHRTAPLQFEDKVAESRDNPYVLPHTRQAILDAFRRAGLKEAWDVQGIETHDCFTTSEYMAIDHFG